MQVVEKRTNSITKRDIPIHIRTYIGFASKDGRCVVPCIINLYYYSNIKNVVRAAFLFKGIQLTTNVPMYFESPET